MGEAPDAEAMIRKIAAWADRRDDVVAVALVGSRARIGTDSPPDEWSDIDVILLTEDPGRYLDDGEWVGELGPPVLTFVEPTLAGLQERRVLFEGGIDVDVVVVPTSALTPELMASFSAVSRRGLRILLDRQALLEGLPGDMAPGGPDLPGEHEFLELVNNFLYHCLWSAKKLARGELWTAKRGVDAFLKELLLTMIRWHAMSRHGPAYDTWHEARFVERWADGRVVHALRGSFARYDARDVARALPETMEVFRTVAEETADALGLEYPGDTHGRVAALVAACLTRV